VVMMSVHVVVAVVLAGMVVVLAFAAGLPRRVAMVMVMMAMVVLVVVAVAVIVVVMPVIVVVIVVHPVLMGVAMAVTMVMIQVQVFFINRGTTAIDAHMATSINLYVSRNFPPLSL
jgi:hypothetical protein